jgi:hypothetical protein
LWVFCDAHVCGQPHRNRLKNRDCVLVMAKTASPQRDEHDGRKLRALYNMLGSENANEHSIAFGHIQTILKRRQQTWDDLLNLIGLPASMDGISPGDRRTLREQHLLLGDEEPEKREAARTAIKWILQRYRLSWNDLLSAISNVSKFDPNPSVVRLLPVPEAPDPLELLTGFLPGFIDVTDDEVLVIALWTLHTFFFAQFEVTPRLVLTSPIPGCGKSTVMKSLELLASTALKTDGATPASIIEMVDADRCTILLDEADNAEWFTNAYLRRVVNSGHDYTGKVTKIHDGKRRTFSTFAPMAIATLDRLPLPLLTRSLIIRMAMSKKVLKKVKIHRDEFDIVRRHLVDWAQGRMLNPEPSIPIKLKNRIADNWLTMFAIADACGKDWGKRVRDLAVRMSARYADDDLKLILLADIRTVFNQRGIDRITCDDLVEALLALPGSIWAEYRGLKDNEPPRKLTTAALRNLLGGGRTAHWSFGIRARTVWPEGKRAKETKSAPGYYRRQFEATWDRYLPPEEHTSTQPNELNEVA